MSVAEIFLSEAMTYGPAPEAPDTAYAWLDAHERKFGLFVNNHWTEPKSGKYLPSTNPATAIRWQRSPTRARRTWITPSPPPAKPSPRGAS